MQHGFAMPPTPPAHTVLRLNPDVVAQRMEEAVVLVHLKTNRIYELNRTGAVFWELLAAGYDRAAVQAQMGRRFAVNATMLEGEIDRLVVHLLTEGLIYSETTA